MPDDTAAPLPPTLADSMGRLADAMTAGFDKLFAKLDSLAGQPGALVSQPALPDASPAPPDQTAAIAAAAAQAPPVTAAPDAPHGDRIAAIEATLNRWAGVIENDLLPLAQKLAPTGESVASAITAVAQKVLGVL